MNNKRGAFITLEGPDGSGKTTNLDYLVELFRSTGYEVVRTREPGGTPLAEKIRALLLTSYEFEDLVPMSELLLFAAARAQHIENVIKPALAEGKVVLCDRFADSTFAYQGAGRGYKNEVAKLEHLVHGGFQPDQTLYFDITFAESMKRLQARDEGGTPNDRMDLEVESFRQRVFQGYRERFEGHRSRMYRVDAMGSQEQVRARLFDWFQKVFMKQYPLT